MTLKDVERVLYFENYVVIEPGLTPLQKQQLLTEEEYMEAVDEYGEDAFTAGSAPKPSVKSWPRWIWKKKCEQLREEMAE
jgi:DNA-directed RNA polymerase subunit beta'